MRQTLRLFLLLAMLCMILRTFCVQGLVAPLRVASGSMAEQWRGPHLACSCPECARPFAAGLDSLFGEEQLLCPECGAEIPLTEVRSEAGDAVILDRTAYLFRDPRRFEVVVFRQPGSESQWAVKRVAGLPSEQMAIRGGDLMIDGAPAYKSYSQWREMAVLVSDSRYVSEGANRWHGSDRESGWSVLAGGEYRFHPVGKETERLLYQHRANFRRTAGTTEDSPLYDLDSYNQGLSRVLHRVRDVSLRASASLEPQAVLTLELTTADHRWQAEFSRTEGRCHLSCDGVEFSVAPCPIASTASEFELTYCDSRVWVAFDDRPLIEHRVETEKAVSASEARPVRFAVGGRLGGIRIERLRVERDIHYLDPTGRYADWPGRRLSDHEFLLLGDNVPLSFDGRHWPAGSVDRRNLLGRAYLWR